MCRHLEKQAGEEKERERQERRRKERKNRDAFMELLQQHLADGLIVARMRWKVPHFLPVPVSSLLRAFGRQTPSVQMRMCSHAKLWRSIYLAILGLWPLSSM